MADPTGSSEEAALLRTLLGYSADAVLWIDADGAIRYASPGASALVQQDRAALIGQPVGMLIHPEDRAETVAGLLGTEDGAGPTVQTFRIAAADPVPRWLEGAARRLPAMAERTGFVWSLRDVTRRFVGAGLDQIETIMEQAAEAVLITEADLDRPGPRIVYANPAFTAMTGYTPDEVIGRTPRLLQGPRTDRAVLDRLRRQLSQGTMFQGETINYRKDGTPFVMEWHIAPIRDASGRITHWVAMQRDRTEQRRLERQVLEASAREQRRIAQDLHDGLGQQLTGVAFLLRSLEEQMRAEGHPDVETVSQVAGLVQESVEQTRNLARGLFPVGLEEGLHDALQDLSVQVKQFYDVPCVFVQEGTVDVADTTTAVYLFRIAQEAAVNAVRHAAPSQITILLRALPEGAQLRIEDDGRGLTAAEAPEGIGLRIMRYRAGQIHAQLSIAPRPEGGTAVTCTFDPQVVPAMLWVHDKLH